MSNKIKQVMVKVRKLSNKIELNLPRPLDSDLDLDLPLGLDHDLERDRDLDRDLDLSSHGEGERAYLKIYRKIKCQSTHDPGKSNPIT